MTKLSLLIFAVLLMLAKLQVIGYETGINVLGITLLLMLLYEVGIDIRVKIKNKRLHIDSRPMRPLETSPK